MGLSSDQILVFVTNELQKYNPNGISLTADTDIAVDLEMDSVAQIDLLFALEEQFDISVPLNALSEVRTIADLVSSVEHIIKQEHVPS